MSSHVVSEEETAQVIAGLVKQLRSFGRVQAFAEVLFELLEKDGMDVADMRARFHEKAEGHLLHLRDEIDSAYLNGVPARDGEEEEPSDDSWLLRMLVAAMEGK